MCFRKPSSGRSSCWLWKEYDGLKEWVQSKMAGDVKLVASVHLDPLLHPQSEPYAMRIHNSFMSQPLAMPGDPFAFAFFGRRG